MGERKVFRLERPELGAFVEIEGEKRDSRAIPELEVLMQVGENAYSSYMTSRDTRPCTSREIQGCLCVLNSHMDRSHALVIEGRYPSLDEAEALVLNYWRSE